MNQSVADATTIHRLLRHPVAHAPRVSLGPAGLAFQRHPPSHLLVVNFQQSAGERILDLLAEFGFELVQSAKEILQGSRNQTSQWALATVFIAGP